MSKKKHEKNEEEKKYLENREKLSRQQYSSVKNDHSGCLNAPSLFFGLDVLCYFVRKVVLM